MSSLVNERYRLEVHWSRVEFKEGVCLLYNAYLCGPVLSITRKISPNDHIMLDFYSQYIYFVSKPYIGDLYWGEVDYKDKTIILHDTKIINGTDLSKVPKLKNSDYLLIDTSNHKEDIHGLNLFYKTYVVDEVSNRYEFER